MQYSDIQNGDTITVKTKFGEYKGKAVMFGPAGWVLNNGSSMQIVGPDNFVKGRKGRNRKPDYFGKFLQGDSS